MLRRAPLLVIAYFLIRVIAPWHLLLPPLGRRANRQIYQHRQRHRRSHGAVPLQRRPSRPVRAAVEVVSSLCACACVTNVGLESQRFSKILFICPSLIATLRSLDKTLASMQGLYFFCCSSLLPCLCVHCRYYFWAAPTLTYQLNFPRSPTRRGWMVYSLLIRIAGCVSLMVLFVKRCAFEPRPAEL